MNSIFAYKIIICDFLINKSILDKNNRHEIVLYTVST